MDLRIFFPDFRQGLHQIVQSLDRIIPLTYENAVALTMLRFPDRPIEAVPQCLIQEMIGRPGIDLLCTPSVPAGPPRHMSGISQRLFFIFSPHPVFLLLPAQIVLFYHIPERFSVLNGIRQIRHIIIRIDKAQPLDADECPLWPVKRSRHSQCMRIFRTETVNDIRFELI